MQIAVSPDVAVQWQLTCARVREWMQEDVFTIRWWALLALFMITVFIGWKKVDKARLKEMMLFYAIIIVFIIVLDEFGEELSLWYYTTDILPLFPPITAVNISCMPVVYLLIYQYARSWKSFLIATVVMAAIFCFVLEPVFVWAGIYRMLIWKSYYGFPLYILIAVVSKCVVTSVLSVTRKKSGAPGSSAT